MVASSCDSICTCGVAVPAGEEEPPRALAPCPGFVEAMPGLQTEREIELEAEVKRLKEEVEPLRQFHENVMSHRKETNDTQETRGSRVSLSEDADDVDRVMAEASDSDLSMGTAHQSQVTVEIGTNVSTVLGSALAKSRLVQSIIYLLAIGGVVFVFASKATKLGETEDGHRRLGGGASKLLLQIAFCVTSAGLMGFIVNMVKLPLILGYLLGGILVGPRGLDIVHSQEDISDMSSLGLVFLLFMIGLELDVSEILKMGKVVIGTGLLQFPLCAAVMTGLFTLFQAAGLSWGSGEYAALYVGTPCAISSTMIVVKLLAEHAEMDTAPGRLTVGILIFQDIWAIIVLAIQPDMANPKILGLLKTFAMIAALIIIALLYAKFVMPALFVYTSKSIELMLIISLSWCFFMCCLATLPYVGLSMELAALISGVALATFPYSAEFNGKIKYIRDFFITLFFVGLGMQIPVPTVAAVGKGLVVALVVVLFRWLGIFAVVMMLRGGHRLASLATINLSQVSEFALVICSLGMGFGHINDETLTIVIWSFSFLAIASSYMIGYNHHIYTALCRWTRKLIGGKRKGRGDNVDTHEEGGDHVDRNIVLLGFHRVAAMLIAHFEHHNPHLLAKVHVIDIHEHIMPELRKRGLTCAYGDISSRDVLEHAHHGDVRLVICSIPDSLLRGVSNLRLLQLSKQVWPTADVIVSAENPRDAHRLYHAGAEYVLRMAKLCAERLESIIVDHSTHATQHHQVGQDLKLNHVFNVYKEKELDDHMSTNFPRLES